MEDTNRMIAMAVCRQQLRLLVLAMRRAAALKKAEQFEREFSDWEKRKD